MRSGAIRGLLTGTPDSLMGWSLSLGLRWEERQGQEGVPVEGPGHHFIGTQASFHPWRGHILPMGWKLIMEEVEKGHASLRGVSVPCSFLCCTQSLSHSLASPLPTRKHGSPS